MIGVLQVKWPKILICEAYWDRCVSLQSALRILFKFFFFCFVLFRYMLNDSKTLDAAQRHSAVTSIQPDAPTTVPQSIGKTFTYVIQKAAISKLIIPKKPQSCLVNARSARQVLSKLFRNRNAEKMIYFRLNFHIFYCFVFSSHDIPLFWYLKL